MGLNVRTVQHNGLRWINIVKPTDDEVSYLRREFKFHPLDLRDCLSPAQRPKIEKYPDYIFLVLLFPVFNRKTREIFPAEVDFFIGPDYLITVHDDQLVPLVDLFELCNMNDDAVQKNLKDGIQSLLYTVLNSLMQYCYPMMDHLSIDISTIEKKIFAGEEKTMVKEILIIRRNITNFRKVMQTHKNIIKKLVESRDERVYRLTGLMIYFQQLVEDAKDIWDTLQGFKEAIEALQETNESLISFKINDVIKTLTIISVLALPVNFVVFMFSAGAANTPFIHVANGFWILGGLCAVVGLSLFAYVKKKGMLK
ncbi:MAG: magnesium transporter CorA family protein [Patescibacteria group bacterium]|jgi:magnesium transporter